MRICVTLRHAHACPLSTHTRVLKRRSAVAKLGFCHRASSLKDTLSSSLKDTLSSSLQDTPSSSLKDTRFGEACLLRTHYDDAWLLKRRSFRSTLCHRHRESDDFRACISALTRECMSTEGQTAMQAARCSAALMHEFLRTNRSYA